LWSCTTLWILVERLTEKNKHNKLNDIKGMFNYHSSNNARLLMVTFQVALEFQGMMLSEWKQ